MTNLYKSDDTYLKLIKNIFFIIMCILIYRFATYIPLPSINIEKVHSTFNNQYNYVFSLFNLFSGGSLSRLTFCSLGIMPYISASITMQLLCSIIPYFNEIKKHGSIGQTKIIQFTRYLTLLISIFESVAITIFIQYNQLLICNTYINYIDTIITLTTGSIFLMWLGEQISKKNIGNGISILIFTSIISVFPKSIIFTITEINNTAYPLLIMFLFIIITYSFIFLIILIENAQRKIIISNPRKQYHFYKNKNVSKYNYLPLKINIAGVLPPIFATTILLLPSSIEILISNNPHFIWLKYLILKFYDNHFLYSTIFAILTVILSFFYSKIIFNTKETAENLKKSAHFIPGIRPGEQTSKYITIIMNRLTIIGSIYIIYICMLPILITNISHIKFYFSGTSILILIVVILDIISKIQSYLMSKRYDNILKKMN